MDAELREDVRPGVAVALFRDSLSAVIPEPVASGRRQRRWVLSFTELASSSARSSALSELGGKAASLVEMVRMGLPVPAGFCLSVRAMRAFVAAHPGLAQAIAALDMRPADEEALASIRQGLLELPFPNDLADDLLECLGSSNLTFAVRSSGAKEDLAGASFAGLYVTHLNIRGLAGVERAVRACWASAFTERVLTYAARHRIRPSELAMAVVVQEFVAAERSGVVFSVNPLTGRDTHMLIESCHGLGEALVGGEITPEQVVFDWQQKREVSFSRHRQTHAHLPLAAGQGTMVRALEEPLQHERILSENEVAALVGFALRLQTHHGFPVDIEWVIARGRVQIVQCRPVTSVSHAAIQGQWTTADFKDGGVSSAVCSQAMWSLYDLIWEEQMPAYLRKVRLLLDGGRGNTCWGDMFFGRPYWNATAVKDCAKRIPGFVEREFDESLGIQVGYEGKGHVTRITPRSVLDGVRTLFALRRSFRERIAYNRQVVPRIRERLARLAAVAPESLQLHELTARFRTLILDDYRLVEGSYFLHIFDNSNVQTLFRDLLKPYRERVNLLHLLGGLEEISHLQPNFELWILSRNIRASDADLAYWCATSTAGVIAALRAGQCGHQLPAVRAFVEKYGFHSVRELDITVPNYREDPSFVVENLKTYLELGDERDPRRLNEQQRHLFEQERARLLGCVPFWRRRAVAERVVQMREFLWWREELRDLSTRMYDQIRRDLLAVGAALVELRYLDAPENVFFLPVTEILGILEQRPPADMVREQVWRNRHYYFSFRNYANPPDIGFASCAAGPEGATLLTGIPCSPGQVTARACVIRGIEDVGRLRDGDILVTRFTDPAWTPVFGRIAGVITETGGALSHAAVIAREYGIPAILAVPAAMQRISDGHLIRMDGNAGKIHLDAEGT